MRSWQASRGFTLIELLVVIVILAVLMSIAIPAYLSQQVRAQDTEVAHYLSVAYKNARSTSPDPGSKFASSLILAQDLASSEPELTVVTGTPANLDPNNPKKIVVDQASGSAFSVIHGQSKSGHQFTMTALPGSALDISSYANQVYQDTPLAYWRFDETSGKIAHDFSGAGHDLTLASGAHLGAAMGAFKAMGDASALNFTQSEMTGCGGHFQIACALQSGSGSLFDFSGTTPFSVEAWVKPTATDIDANFHRLISNEDDGGASGRNGWDIEVTGSSFGFCIFRYVQSSPSNIKVAACSGTLPQANTWYLITATYDGSKLRMYQNGQLASAPNDTNAIPATPTEGIVLGSRSVNSGDSTNAGTGNGLDGSMKDMSIYDHALSAARVKAHFDSASIMP